MNENLQNWIEAGRKAANEADTSAAMATACCYLVYRASFGIDADPDASQDFHDAINKEGAKIVAENNQLDIARDNGKRLKLKWKIPDRQFEGLPDDDPRKEEARKLYSLPRPQFDALKKVALQYVSQGDAVISLVVRHTTGFFFSSERSSVSLYKYATQWLHDEFKDTPRAELDAETLKKAIQDSGDFSSVVEQQRAKSAQSLHKTTGKKAKPIKVELAKDVDLPEGKDLQFFGDYNAKTRMLKITFCSVRGEDLRNQTGHFQASPALPTPAPSSTATSAAPTPKEDAEARSKKREPEPA